ncbi:hypothetical protein ACG2LH_04415 [Zhouia sp. PK063]|uniref:hypothetical protein n=1 Tax=Zhouia sp. PK063 TaxID=3373602 RepID=UPI0037BC1FD8
MSKHFVIPIVEAIRTLYNNKYPLDYYLGFAWDGLRKYGRDGYRNIDGEWVKDFSNNEKYYSLQEEVRKNTEFGNDCSN